MNILASFCCNNVRVTMMHKVIALRKFYAVEVYIDKNLSKGFLTGNIDIANQKYKTIVHYLQNNV